MKQIAIGPIVNVIVGVVGKTVVASQDETVKGGRVDEADFKSVP